MRILKTTDVVDISDDIDSLLALAAPSSVPELEKCRVRTFAAAAMSLLLPATAAEVRREFDALQAVTREPPLAEQLSGVAHDDLARAIVALSVREAVLV
ncbi:MULTISPECIES: hypothetical protein [Cereibacter]|uniref:Uncharacterized protein n=1 Tax=Cereibacter azotoformans TaxID=43057 RepID=A0A2T5JT71_9RHOB|nr:MULTISPECIES: hypothetical protein [Cereibacter]PTR13375.1 hypothetical protein C8J28_1225 [Cereibacter azotoformans]